MQNMHERPYLIIFVSCRCTTLHQTPREPSEWCTSYSYPSLYLFGTHYRFTKNNVFVFSYILLFIIPLWCKLHFCSGAYLFQGHDLWVSVMLRCSIVPSSCSLWSVVRGIGFLLYLCYDSEGCSKGVLLFSAHVKQLGLHLLHFVSMDTLNASSKACLCVCRMRKHKH